MIKIPITDIEDTKISGVTVQLPAESEPYKESYFEWTASSLICEMNSTKISGGILKAWHHVPVFHEVESHTDAEMFYFISGTAIMLFIDIVGGKADPKTAQMVRIRAGTQITIAAGKGHFVMVAQGDEPVHVVVVSPKMDAPRTALPEEIQGI